MPLSLLLFKADLDVWKPGEHNGTFRASQLSLVAATAALEYYKTDDLMKKVREGCAFIERFFGEKIAPIDKRITHRGIGLIHGFDFSSVGEGVAQRVRKECFLRGLVIETAGKGSNVLKLLPPLVIEKEDLERGLTIICDGVKKTICR